jgi:AraC-like DNA-binding protein
MLSNPTTLDLCSDSAAARSPTKALQKPTGSQIRTLSAFPPELNQDQRQRDHQRQQVRTRNVNRRQPLVSIIPSERVARRIIEWSDNFYADFVESIDHGRLEFRFRAPVHALVVYEHGVRREGHSFVEGLPQSSRRDLARRLTVVPAGHEFVEWHLPRVLPRLSYFYFDPVALNGGSDSVGVVPNFTPRLLFEDTALWDSARKLKAAIEEDKSDDSLYVDALAVVLTHEIARLNATVSDRSPRGGLAGWQQRSVTAYIEEHVADQIRLSTLAQIARLSPYHFCRAFKRSVGFPPHQYHAIRRIERAKAMLAKRSMSVMEIGFALGFTHATSFTTTFRRVTGMTPTQYQKTLE